MKLEPLMTYRADLKPAVEVGKGPFGTRSIHDVTGGIAKGPRISGKLLPSGADWLLVDESGLGRLDVRGTLETDDGAHIYIYYHGVLELNEKVVDALAKGEGTAHNRAFHDLCILADVDGTRFCVQYGAFHPGTLLYENVFFTQAAVGGRDGLAFAAEGQ